MEYKIIEIKINFVLVIVLVKMVVKGVSFDSVLSVMGLIIILLVLSLELKRFIEFNEIFSEKFRKII